MSRLVVRAPSRLHFGLLGWGPGPRRQFGGVGLMVDDPGLEVEAELADVWSFSGPLAARAATIAGRVEALDPGVRPARVRVRRAPPEHVGLGTGTQLGMAVARLLTALSGRADLPASDLARLAGRGRRSGIGLHGFALGGLLVDGGHPPGRPEAIPPLLARVDLPEEWSILVVIPETQPGLHGDAERRAFAGLEAVPEATTERLCRLVLLGLLPSVAEAHLDAFGAALDEMQEVVGRQFAKAQGGIYASERSAELVADLRGAALRGVGQSSWGPVVYGFSDADDGTRQAVVDAIRARYGLDETRAFWSRPSGHGATLCG